MFAIDLTPIFVLLGVVVAAAIAVMWIPRHAGRHTDARTQRLLKDAGVSAVTKGTEER